MPLAPEMRAFHPLAASAQLRTVPGKQPEQGQSCHLCQLALQLPGLASG